MKSTINYTIFWRNREDFPITWHIQSSNWKNKKLAIRDARRNKQETLHFAKDIEFLVVKIEKKI